MHCCFLTWVALCCPCGVLPPLPVPCASTASAREGVLDDVADPGTPTDEGLLFSLGGNGELTLARGDSVDASLLALLELPEFARNCLMALRVLCSEAEIAVK